MPSLRWNTSSPSTNWITKAVTQATSMDYWTMSKPYDHVTDHHDDSVWTRKENQKQKLPKLPPIERGRRAGKFVNHQYNTRGCCFAGSNMLDILTWSVKESQFSGTMYRKVVERFADSAALLVSLLSLFMCATEYSQLPCSPLGIAVFYTVYHFRETLYISTQYNAIK